MFKTPILLLIFNRLDTTQRVMDAIKKVKPECLFIAADGPREDKQDDKLKCDQVRNLVMQSISWNCEVKTLLREENLGCRDAVSSSISWFFSYVEEGIILEDDTLPHHSFFKYCSAMLDRYRNDEKVMHIAGVNFQDGIKRGSGSYYFSKYPHIWGWATWRRAWERYDVSMSEWPRFKISEKFQNWCINEQEQNFWRSKLDDTYNKIINTWDYQWVFSIMRSNGLCIMPNLNLITNIGFGSDATHTLDNNSPFANMPVQEYICPDVPSVVAINMEADLYSLENIIFPSDDIIQKNKPTKQKFSFVHKLQKKIKKYTGNRS